jgi:hypothetical protein
MLIWCSAEVPPFLEVSLLDKQSKTYPGFRLQYQNPHIMANIIIHSATPILPAPLLIDVQLVSSNSLHGMQKQSF